MRNLALAQIDGLSARAVNCCNDVGIATLGDLFDYIKDKSLKTIRNCGMKTARELNQIISTYESRVAGYHYNLFAMDYQQEVDVSEPPQPVYAEAVDEPSAIEETDAIVSLTFQSTDAGRELGGTELLESLNEAYVECLDESQDQLAEKVKLRFPNIESVLLMVSQQPEGLLDNQSDWSIEDHFRFWDFCYELLDDMIKTVDDNRYPSLLRSLNVAHDYVHDNLKYKKLSLMRSRLSCLSSSLAE